MKRPPDIGCDSLMTFLRQFCPRPKNYPLIRILALFVYESFSLRQLMHGLSQVGRWGGEFSLFQIEPGPLDGNMCHLFALLIEELMV